MAKKIKPGVIIAGAAAAAVAAWVVLKPKTTPATEQGEITVELH